MGLRREFRVTDRQATRPDNLLAPSVIVAWREVGGEYEAKLMVLERVWRERLGEISQDSLKAEGFLGPDAIKRFRREWSDRTHRQFDLLRKVWVFRLRPLSGEDEFSELAFLHLAHLYEEHLSPEMRERVETIKAKYEADPTTA